MKVFPKVYYAVPKGLVKVDEIPDGIGLIVRSDKGWYVEKAPKINKNTPNLNIDVLLSFLFHGYEHDRKIRKLSDKISIKENMSLSWQAKRIGEEISKLVDRKSEKKYTEWINDIAESLYKHLGLEMYKKHNETYLPDPYELDYVFKALSKYKEDPQVQESLNWINNRAQRECFSFDGSSRKLVQRMKQINKSK
jgi:hypothetical protein